MSSSVVQSKIAKFSRERKFAIEDLLCYYGKVSITDKVLRARLSDFDLKSFTIRFHHVELESDVDKIIAFEPPLNEVNEFDERINEMIKIAAKARGLSEIQVTETVYPTNLLEYAIIGGVMLPPLCYLYRPLLYFLPLPSIIKKTLDNDRLLFIITVLAFFTHIIESLVLLRPKLIYYRVPIDHAIEWYFLGLLEGYAPVKRLEALAQKIQKQK
ncbi:hypothetical protein Kpol_495p13 [Vanderwaltozyma polyspora DSM 70294]|uniref:DUF2470 domain-containing protein n=1 Tax=Vanderwaltozyma polyspora (strain ATCC 22028 / DSM 70294 / BCRC 21397 / CBS 2163 / NBRC 10782 / NRRL Y-8283 / UCD 57-17) TaxID=436907 RepID=A7TNZ0_VANPO|nr:uncharacterized protein Kpol_495p13 [Vanderwaltozyma polyspora DSM 70294]EDO16015.1 hypothetical protein Kpol_495p13 [Vanderwaltozyma polyspora DSM 70294]